jgi:hypothetical protein
VIDSWDGVNFTGIKVVCPKIAKPVANPKVTLTFKVVLALEK